MEILIYRYNSICEPDVISCFQKMGLDVIEETTQISRKDTTASETVDAVGRLLQEHRFLFVFSINFFPALSEVCRIFKVPYVCWTVDVPVQELFSPSLSNDCNRIFMFDRSQYEYFKDRNPGHIFHLPLATNTQRWDSVIGSAGSTLSKYAADISFIGSLYKEKNPYPKINGMNEYVKGYLDGLMEAQMQLWGVNFLESMLNEAVLADFDRCVPDMHTQLNEGNTAAQKYLIAHSFLGSQIAVTERERYLSAVSEHFPLELYTLSDASALPKAHVHPKGAKTLTEMPLIFNQSRINLNITIRPIASGLSLRLFDVCGCGGFLLTNWQEELPELYEPGTEVETFSSIEEMLDKADYYLENEEERKKIALAGYERTRAEHTYEKRIAQMISVINDTL
ncbi:MAG: glycosyltransferase [Lachnospiraceae bacterium]|nr:glycosyltransferase [Lachnospiraceae bacterium]